MGSLGAGPIWQLNMRSVVTGIKCQNTKSLETPESPTVSQLPSPVCLSKAGEIKTLAGICISKEFPFNLIMFVMRSANELWWISTNSLVPKQTWAPKGTGIKGWSKAEPYTGQPCWGQWHSPAAHCSFALPGCCLHFPLRKRARGTRGSCNCSLGRGRGGGFLLWETQAGWQGLGRGRHGVFRLASASCSGPALTRLVSNLLQGIVMSLFCCLCSFPGRTQQHRGSPSIPQPPQVSHHLPWEVVMPSLLTRAPPTCIGTKSSFIQWWSGISLTYLSPQGVPSPHGPGMLWGGPALIIALSGWKKSSL